MWPLRLDSQLVAVVYLDQTHGGFPEPHQQPHGRVLADRVRALHRPTATRPYVSELADRTDVRRQLEAVLRQVAGNVSAAARLLGVNRDTIYERPGRLAIDVASFRPHSRDDARFLTGRRRMWHP